jgi:hypothetical protein
VLVEVFGEVGAEGLDEGGFADSGGARQAHTKCLGRGLVEPPEFPEDPVNCLLISGQCGFDCT